MPTLVYFFFFFNDTATTEIYTLSLHDALPISWPIPAMSHTGHHEQSQPVLWLRPHPCQHARVIVDAVLRRDRPTRAAVVPAVVDEKFPTTSPKGRKIRIHGVDEARFLLDQRGVAIQVERAPVPRRVFVRYEPEHAHVDPSRFRLGACQHGPAHLAARH